MIKDVLTLQPGQIIEFDNKKYKITRLLDLEWLTAKNIASGKEERLLISDVSVSKEDDNTFNEKEELSLITKKDWDEANRRLKIITPLLSIRRRKDSKEIREKAEKAKVHVATIYRWIEAYSETGLVSALLPKKQYPEGKTRLPIEIESIIQSTIEKVYLHKRKRSIKATHLEIERLCKAKSLPTPHELTVRKRINAILEKDRIKARHGTTAAEQIYAPAPDHFSGADFPLAVVQIDHTKLERVLENLFYRRECQEKKLLLKPTI